jgi:signal transduction histidine kinase
MVGDMLSVAQIESGSIKLQQGDVRLEPVFEELRADFAEQARQKEIKLRFDMPPKWPQMKGDRDKIVMALHNLVGNAIKYTPAGGEVIVRAAPSSDEKMFVVDVVDNGIGIKDEEQTLVFEKFYRAQDKRIAGVTGTGLGLAIAREVVRLHGGDISLKSAIDKGSTFTMTLTAKAA